MYISLEQALNVYDTMIEAEKSGAITTVFVSKMMPYNPMYAMFPFNEEDKLTEKKAAEDFHSLCHIFAKNHNVKVEIDGSDLHDWIKKIRSGENRFYLSVGVRVTKL